MQKHSKVRDEFNEFRRQIAALYDTEQGSTKDVSALIASSSTTSLFMEDFGMDSIEYVSFLMAVEEKFGLDFDEGASSELTMGELHEKIIESQRARV